ncbi:LOW QUALITY PROTEIN: hypothetical protein JCM24511_08958 [Saitozyma sp. JCM 24511]|nr:LOW QUALITY PROTEIN: hypothetical protein JCM24511_08958 [Saitozyma sp. JCM 24511]
MAAQVELFSRLIMETKLVGVGYKSHERAARLVGTTLGPAFHPIIAEINAVALGRWYSRPTTPKRLAVLLDRPHHVAVLATIGQPWISREAVERERKDRRPDTSKVECYQFHKTSHYARHCRSKTKGGGNLPKGHQIGKKHRRGH